MHIKHGASQKAEAETFCAQLSKLYLEIAKASKDGEHILCSPLLKFCLIQNSVGRDETCESLPTSRYNFS